MSDGDRVRVSSRRGQIDDGARVGKTNLGRNVDAVPFQDGNSNWLTIAALDRVSKAPEYKVCAIPLGEGVEADERRVRTRWRLW